MKAIVSFFVYTILLVAFVLALPSILLLIFIGVANAYKIKIDNDEQGDIDIKVIKK